MIGQLLNAAVLLTLCVFIHAFGTLLMFRRYTRLTQDVAASEPPSERLRRPWLYLALSFIQIFFLHVIEMGLWACAYWLEGAIATFEEALYFSIVSFTTVGYGDVVLPEAWRIFGAAEAATGNLLLGWSTGLMFMLVQRLYRDIILEPPSK